MRKLMRVALYRLILYGIFPIIFIIFFVHFFSEKNIKSRNENFLSDTKICIKKFHKYNYLMEK